MKLEDLSLMKYGDLWKIAKERFNITRRMSKEKLIKKLLEHHQSYLSDGNFISADDSTDNSNVDSEVIMQESTSRRGRKRGKEQSEEQKKPLRANKKAKKVAVEHALNSTFSVDEEETGYQETNVVNTALTKKPEETISRTLRGRKKVYLTEDSSAYESENERASARKLKKPRRVDPKEQSSANSEGEKGMMGKKSQTTGDSILQSSVHELEPEKIPKRNLKKSASAVVQNMCEESEAEKVPPKRTRSSGKAVSTEQTSDEQSQSQETPVKNEIKSNERLSSFVGSTESEPSSSTPPVVIRERAVLLRTSSYPVRNRKPTANSSTPAKIAVSSAGGAKKALTLSGETLQTPKLGKPRAAPNFAEIHQKNFLKMQSVDEYVEKKRNRTETMTASARTVRTKSVLNNSVTPQAKPPVIPKSKAATQDTGGAQVAKDIKFNFVSGLQKPVFTAKGQVVNEKQRVVARVKENLQNNVSLIPAATTRTATSIGKRKASMLNVSREINTSKLSLAGKQILKGVRTNRRFELQMQHRNMKN